MEQSALGITQMVDEIMADAFQRIQTGEILPDESSLSLSVREPRARSTSVERNNSDPFGSSCSNLFDEHQENRPPFDSCETFVSADKLLDQFDRDEKRCREENLFKDNHNVPFECPSLAVSPDKIYHKQKPLPSWTEEDVQMDSMMFASSFGTITEDKNSTFSTGSASTASTITLNEDTRKMNITDTREKNATAAVVPPGFGLPTFLGFVIPGMAATFDFPVLMASEIRPSRIKSFVNGRLTTPCVASVRASPKGGTCISIQPPSNIIGSIFIEIEISPHNVLKFQSHCIQPVLRLPDHLVLPPGILARIPIRSMIPFTETVTLRTTSDQVTSKAVILTAGIDEVSVDVLVKEGDTILKLKFLIDMASSVTLATSIDVRPLRISIESQIDPNMSMFLVIRNNEFFPVHLALSDDLGGLIYPKELRLSDGQTEKIPLQRSFKSSYDQKNCKATISLKLLSPVRLLKAFTSCSVTLPLFDSDLRPDLPRFIWLSDKDFIFTMLGAKEGNKRAPVSWKGLVDISPCHLITNYVQILEGPGDPTKVLIRSTRPPKLIVGRLRFYRKSQGANADPFGFRYFILVPEEPSLLWFATAEHSTSRVYRMPLDGKLRVSNKGQCAVFVLEATRGATGRIIDPGSTAELVLREPCRILYGLECWRSVVRHRLGVRRAEVYAQIRNSQDSHDPVGPEHMMGMFDGESSPLNHSEEHAAAEKIPHDPLSLFRLYRLFMSTVEEVYIKGAELEASTFLMPRS